MHGHGGAHHAHENHGTNCLEVWPGTETGEPLTAAGQGDGGAPSIGNVDAMALEDVAQGLREDLGPGDPAQGQEGKLDPKKVIFGQCTECGANILRSQKRKREGESWYHADCIPPPSATGGNGHPGGEPMKKDGGGQGNDARKIAEILERHMKGTAQVDEQKVLDLVSDKFAELAAQLPRPLVLEVKSPDGEVKTIAGAHKDFPKLMYFILKRQHVYLWGPPGSGKSTAARMAAEVQGLRHAYTSLNPQTPESRILGYTDAGGTYRPSVFHDLYKEGGVFCIDEQDNAAPALLTTLNSLLENGVGAFPCGMVDRHPDFVLVSCGNTNGKGANHSFPDRRPFDCAFTERFKFLFWGYDESMEEDVAMAINPLARPWIEYVRSLRQFCMEAYPRLVISPRATFSGGDCLKDTVLDIAEILEAVIWKGMDKDSIARILRERPIPAAVRDIRGKSGSSPGRTAELSSGEEAKIGLPTVKKNRRG